MAAELGSAYISVGLGTSSLTGDIKKAFGDAGPAADSAGRSAGGLFSSGFSKIAGALGGLAIGAAAGSALTKGLLDSLNIEAGTDKIQAQLGLTEEQAGVAGAAAGSLYANNYGDSMEGIQTATAAVMSSISGMRNSSQEDIEDITMKALNLASAFEVDVADASATAGQLIKNGLAKDADEAMDLITDAMQGVPASMRGEIFPIMDEYGKHFETLGIDGTTAFGIVKNAAQDGAIGMDKIGDALKEITLKTVTLDKNAVTAFESIGLSSTEMADGMAAGGEIGQAAFAKTIAGLQAIEDPAEQAQTAIALFGTPLEDLGTHNIPAFLGQLDPMGDAFGDVAGAADQMNKDLNSNAKAGFDGFIRQAESAMITFVQNELMPSVDKFAGYLNTTLGPALAGVGPWIKNEALPALGSFGDWFLFVIPGLSDFVSFLKTDVGPNLLLIRDWINNEALPALKVFGDWFAENKETVKGWVTVILIVLIPMFVQIGIAAAASAAVQVAAWALSAGEAIKTAAIYVVQSYVIIGRWIAMSAAAIASGAVTVAIWALYAIEAVKGAIVYTVQAATVAAAWVAMSTAAVISGIKTAAVWAVQVVASAVTGVVAFLVQTALVVGGWVAMATAATVNAIVMAAGWVVGVVTPAAAATIAFLIGVATVVGGWIAMAAGAVVNAAIMAASWLIAFWPVALIAAIVIGLVALVIMNWEAISKFTAEAWANISKFVSDAWNNIVNWVTSAIGNVYKTIFMTASAIKMYWDNFWSTIGRKVSEIWESIKTGVSNGIDNVVNFVRDLPGKVLGFFSNAGTLLLDAGGNIIEGFLSGLQAGFEEVKNFVGGIGQWIADNKGPKAYDLALLVPAGGWIMDGLEDGIEGSLPSLRRTLGGVSATIAAGVTGAGHSSSYTPASAGVAGPGAGVSIGTVHVRDENEMARLILNKQRDAQAAYGF